MRQHSRCRLRLCACWLALWASCALGAQDTPPKDTPPKDAALEALVGQLSDDDWKAREKAQQELARFGAQAVPRLKELAGGTKDPDLRARVEGILRQIEENDASGPTFVTLKLADAPPAEAFEELARQAGAKLDAPSRALLLRDDIPRVTIDAQRQPFWVVMRQLCTSCKVRPDRSGGRTLTLTADDGSWGRRPFVTSGPFIVTANELYVTRGVRLGAAEAEGAKAQPQQPPPPGPNPAPAELIERMRLLRVQEGNEGVRDHGQLQVSALFEPKLHGMSWSLGAVLEASDDAGRSLLLPRGAEPRRRSTYGSARAGEWEATVWLNVPPEHRPGARLAKVKFLSTFTVRTGVETFEVPDILSAKNVERTVGPSRVVVKGLTKLSDDQYELSTASYPVGDVTAWRSVDAGQAGRGPRLLDAEGRDFMRGGGSSSMSATEQSSQIRFTTAGAPGNPRQPAKVVWELPSGVQQFKVPVEFVDLPLP